MTAGRDLERVAEDRKAPAPALLAEHQSDRAVTHPRFIGAHGVRTVLTEMRLTRRRGREMGKTPAASDQALILAKTAQ